MAIKPTLSLPTLSLKSPIMEAALLPFQTTGFGVTLSDKQTANTPSAPLLDQKIPANQQFINQLPAHANTHETPPSVRGVFSMSAPKVASLTEFQGHFKTWQKAPHWDRKVPKYFSFLRHTNHFYSQMAERISYGNLSVQEKEFILLVLEKGRSVPVKKVEQSEHLLVLWNFICAHLTEGELQKIKTGVFLAYLKRNLDGDMTKKEAVEHIFQEIIKFSSVPDQSLRTSFMSKFFSTDKNDTFTPLILERLRLTGYKVAQSKTKLGGVMLIGPDKKYVHLLDVKDGVFMRVNHRRMKVRSQDVRYHILYQDQLVPYHLGDMAYSHETKPWSKPATIRTYVNAKNFMVNGIYYTRVPFAEHPEILIGYTKQAAHSGYKLDLHSGNLSHIRLFYRVRDDVIPIKPENLKIDVTSDHHGLSYDETDKIISIKKVLPKNNHRSDRHYYKATSESGLATNFTIWGLFAEQIEKYEIHKNLLSQGVNVPTEEMFMSALTMLPYQVLTQPTKHQFQLFPKTISTLSEHTMADMSGAFFAISSWSQRELATTLVHEALGHHTHWGREKDLFPIMILIALFEDFNPTLAEWDSYSQKTLGEFWSVSQEFHHQRESELEESYPRMAHLLSAVLTNSGRRWNPKKKQSLAALGFQISLRDDALKEIISTTSDEDSDKP